MSDLPILRPEVFAALALFAFANSITPGPNNMMLMASGANFGLRRTLPHWAGVVVGFVGLLLACGLGLGGLFAAYPVLHEVLKWAGVAYLLYLAGRIALSSSLSATKGGGRPMTFFEAVAFQAVNVKAWAMALGAATTYVPAERYMAGIAVAAVVFAVINAPCVALWLTCGVVLRRFLERPAILRAFNVIMALLLVASLYPMLF
ncbi:LysE family translocator [Phenylobacterium sp.]|jgi:threonine/homoserine/homoserine lactone efflux protein|uniref:LysE family translocator n=1 Tax=Phenylobacterium sp. TaxID=1871053 RepID=UPI0037834D6D